MHTKRGAYGRLKVVKNPVDGVEYMYKHIDNAAIYENERTVHMNLNGHPNIVRYYDSFSNVIKMEYAPLGDLVDWMHGEPLGEEFTLMVIDHISTAIKFCHEKGYIHRDVKLENILVFSDGFEYKLCDFGLACDQGDKRALRRLSGTIHSLAPEQYLRGNVGKKVDVWALGIVMYQLLTGEAFGVLKAEEIVVKLKAYTWCLNDYIKYVSGDIHLLVAQKLEGTHSPECIDLLLRMLEYDPEKRISIEEVCEHPWISCDDGCHV
jgi:serine/threonine protein kinase